MCPLCFTFYFVELVQHVTIHVSGISVYCNDVVLLIYILLLV